MIDAVMCTGTKESSKTLEAQQAALLAECYLLELVQSIHGSCRTIVCDNWFTSIPAARKLLEKKLTLVGTFGKNKL